MFYVQKPGFFFILSITIFAVLITSTESQAQPAYAYHDCSDSSKVDPSSNDGYNTTLNTLFDSLSSKASTNSFLNESLDKVYGLYLCRGDISAETCQTCVKQSSQDIQTRCPSYKTAIIWYDMCTLRYSNVSFFGVVQMNPGALMWNVANNSKPDDTDFGALALIFNLVDRAPNNEIFYMAEDSDSGSNQKRYGLVQCTRDINSDQCRSCLDQLTTEIKGCCNGKVGWRLLAPNCNIRYEERLFYILPALPPSAPPPTVISLPAPDTGKTGGIGTVKIVVIAVSSSLGVLAAALGFGLLCYSTRRKKLRAEGHSEEVLLRNFKSSNHPSFMEGGIISGGEDNSGEMNYLSLATIETATNGFADENKLGEGGFGPVYKGKLPNGKEIAVKRLSVKSNQGLDEFKNEVILIIKLQHKNLVRLLGYCYEQDEKLLVYEYMANTSLDAFLFDPVKCKELDWERRANIINGTARGLLYLHEDSRLKIIHRDMKASNVLLDDAMDPKISDFGTAKIFGGKQIEASTERIVGTFGYMAPEYALEGLISVKSDVYSFGILMLEIISGRKNREFYHQENTQNLLSHAWQLWMNGKGEDLLDQNIMDTILVGQALRWIHIALLCVQHDPGDRPTMSQVVFMLGNESVNLPQLSSERPYSAVRFTGSDTDNSSSSWAVTGSSTERSIS